MAVTLYTSDAEMRSNMVRSLHGWWRSKCGTEIPDRADLDPTHLKPLLPNLFISDVEPEPFRIRYRLVGTKAVEATGMDITGRYLDELLPADGSEPWMGLYQRAYLTRAPVFGAAKAPTKAGGQFI